MSNEIYRAGPFAVVTTESALLEDSRTFGHGYAIVHDDTPQIQEFTHVSRVAAIWNCVSMNTQHEGLLKEDKVTDNVHELRTVN